MRRRLVILLLASTTAHADTSLGFNLRSAYVPAGSDHGNWFGLGVSLERSLLDRIALRFDGAFDAIGMSSDECTYRYGGQQVTGLAGIRVDLARTEEPVLPHATRTATIRLYYAGGLGAAALRTTPCSDNMTATSARFYVKPVAFGVDYAVTPSTALRIEGAALVHFTEYDPLAVVFSGGVAFTL